jgi:hypothetical protein
MRRKRPASRPARISFAELEREKQASRDADARDLASGRKSVDQLRAENELFYGARVWIDYSSCKNPR